MTIIPAFVLPVVADSLMAATASSTLFSSTIVTTVHSSRIRHFYSSCTPT